MNTDAAATNELSESEIEGRDLAGQILEQQPAENFTNTGVLKIRGGSGMATNVPIKFTITIKGNQWVSTYRAFWHQGGRMEELTVVHANNSPNFYLHLKWFGANQNDLDNGIGESVSCEPLPTRENAPFANSDFWLGDLGLEFSHWPTQKVLKHERRRGRGCKVLESKNLEPITNGYSRVVSWIDNDSGGIVHAEAYDAKNKLLKVFDPKEFKKVNGQWQLQEMEIRNVQTGSRSRLEFNLESR